MAWSLHIVAKHQFGALLRHPQHEVMGGLSQQGLQYGAMTNLHYGAASAI